MTMNDDILVLEALQELDAELSFSVGKKLLIEFLRGEKSDSVVRNKMHRLPLFGALSGYQTKEIEDMIEQAFYKNFIVQEPLPNKKWVKTLKLADAGIKELRTPRKHPQLGYVYSAITEDDKKVFSSFDFFLSKYNDEQKKAITAIAPHILCIAGAGSGKTTTLTKRIEFLVRFRGINPSKILAITFTRKARQEMEQRLHASGIDVQVETFNSFSEKMLKQHNNLLYDREMRIITYTEKIQLLQHTLQKQGLSVQNALSLYYDNSNKTDTELFAGFLNDCFTIIEHIKHHPVAWDAALSVRDSARLRMMQRVCTEIQQSMTEHGLRDFADQVVDAVKLMEKNPVAPAYDHVLVDEYQDVNPLQIKLLDTLSPKALFCVGDPRQSIFGWRGSDVSCILDFQKKFSAAEVIALRDNYRSPVTIVTFMNEAISSMKLPPLQAAVEGDGTIKLVECANETAEYDFVIQSLLKSSVQRNNIFVLARTHRLLKEMSERMKLLGVKHIIRSEETELRAAHHEEVVLSTIHAIKGMEAHTVFVIGCTAQCFPCKAGDHPVVDLVKDQHYDAFEEERRLFYVALSRAQKELYLTHTGGLTRFLTDKMRDLLQTKKNGKNDAFDRLRAWRAELAREQGVPPFVIFHDSVLLEISARKPETLQELQNIRGVGPTKLMKYGERLLELLM